MDLQVPQECSQAEKNMVLACLRQQPVDRPDAKYIINVIESSIADRPAEG